MALAGRPGGEYTWVPARPTGSAGPDRAPQFPPSSARQAEAAQVPEHDMAKAKTKRASRGTGTRRATRKKSNLPAGISRIDQASTRTHGFFVRVGYHRTREGAWRPKHRSFFGDA